MLLVCHVIRNPRFYVCLILALTLCTIMILPMRRTAADAPREKNHNASPDAAMSDDPESVAEAQKVFSNSAIRFEINQGQTDRRVKYLARGGSSRFFFTPEEVVFVLYQTSNRSKSDHISHSNRDSKTQVVRMRLSGASKDAEVVGELETQAHSNYFIGNDRKKWVTDVPTFAQVRYKGVYPGIDIVYHGNQKQLQYDFELAPGANPDSLAINFSGVKTIKVADDGSLQLLTASGPFQQQAPFAFQDIDGQQVAVDCKYVVRRDEVGFQLGSYDRTRKLIIDPTIVFSTYLGGNGEDRALDIAIDGSKSVYVTGQTVSTDFPLGVAPIEGWNGGTCLSGTYPCFDAFVTKLTPGGGSILYSTYFGGLKDDIGRGITVDALRRAYIVGETGSADFPIPQGQSGPGVWKAVKKGPTDGFMVQLSTLGNEIRYGTFINGFGSGTLSASAEAVAVDILGHVWVGGSTVSIDFPTGNLFGGFTIRSSYCKFGGDNGFLVKINPDPECTDQRNPPCPVAATTPTDPTDFIYGSYICGSGGSQVLDIALDSVGNLWMAGEARASFPTTLDAFQPGISDPSDVNERDGFVAKTDMFGNFLLYASYMGGTSTDTTESIACDSNGNAYVTGTTSSSNFPITPGVVDSNYGGLGEAFVIKFLSSGMPAYSTFVGGANNLDSAAGIAVDDAGNAYITGNTGSTNFPITPDATQSTNGGGGQGDSFLAKLSPDGSAFQFSTYLGGSGSDFGNAVCVDKAGNAYIAGRTSSTNFPTVNAFDSTFGGGQLAWDGFVTKISTEMFVISGRVTDSANIGFNGVTVTLSGSRSGTTTTDVSGNYSFEVPPNGNYTVTPSRSGFSFSPGNLSYSNLNEDKGAYFSTASAQPSPTVFPVPNLGDSLVQDNGAASSTNYGGAPELLDQVKATVGMNRESYLKFDVSGFQSATAVKLKLFGRLSSAQDTNLPASLFSVATTSWDEKTITWNSKPASGGTALDTETIIDTTARWYEWDVTSYVNAERAAGNTVVSFVVKNGTSSTAVTRFNSREAGENMPRLEVTVPTSGTLTSPWAQSGVPTTFTGGSTELTSGVFTITSAGAGVPSAATSDEFHFVYQQISGDFRIITRILNMGNLDANSRAGLQIRASLQADAVHTSLMKIPQQSTTEFTTRLTTGGTNGSSLGISGDWLMLMRSGNEVSAYVSEDGVSWYAASTPVTHTNLPSSVYVGMFVASGHATNVARARFSNVQITQGTQNPPPQVVFMSPKSGATFNANGTIAFSVIAIDFVGGGSITNVEFRTETSVLGNGTESTPNNYDFAWTNVPPGVYTVFARATDNGGAVTTSTPITVSVNPAGATTLNATADAYVTDGQSSINFGSETSLEVEESVAGDSFESYLKFNLSSVSNITHATLRLYPQNVTGAPIISVSEVSDTSWTEGGINWSNRPSKGDFLRLSFRSPTYYTWDITDYVIAEKTAGHQVISLVLHGDLVSGGRATYSSKEAITGGVPELLITDNTYKGRAYAKPYSTDADSFYPLIASYLRRYDALPWSDFQSAITTENSIWASQSAPPASSVPANSAYVPDEILIQYEEGASETTKAQARGRVKGTTKEKLKSATRRASERGPDAGDLELVKLQPGQNVQDAVRLLRNQRGIKFAEPNLIYKAQSLPDDTDFLNGSLWNMYGPEGSLQNEFGSNATGAWAAGHTGATTVYVAVLDTGVQLEHSDLRRNAWTNSLDPVDGIDNDRNGYVDDTYGWDFVNGDNSVFDGAAPPSDVDVHGTHVTGTIAAVGNNGSGVVGVSWRTTFIPVKILGPQETLTLANAVKALDYITDLKIRHGINIIATNNSWGGNPAVSIALRDAIVRSARANILFVTGAGNGGSDGISDDNDLVPNFPANYDTKDLAGYDSVISVASIADDGSFGVASNYGITTVDLAAPGINIRSTVPMSGYASESGTSMAAPHVTGALALYASMYRASSAAATRGAILESARATTTPSLQGKIATEGRLNIGLFGR